MPTDTTAFEAALRADGYLDVLTRDIDAGTWNSAHQHDFDVRALMLAGELVLSHEGRTHTYRVGEIFKLPAGVEHTEQFGPEPTRYLVGRRTPPR